jgi:prepilin-type N-terminal cleavage/methylation domain-containing protein
MKKRGRRGFSLLEVLLAATLGALALLGVMGLFAGGIRVAERLKMSREDAGLALAGEQVERDLRNAFPFYAIGFEGRSEGLEFAGWSTEGTPPRPVRIRYTWDAQQGILRRSVWSFPGETPIRTDVLIDGLIQCEWAYLNPESIGAGNPVWLARWSEAASLPPAIRWDVRRPGLDRPTHRRILALPRGTQIFYRKT